MCVVFYLHGSCERESTTQHKSLFAFPFWKQKYFQLSCLEWNQTVHFSYYSFINVSGYKLLLNYLFFEILFLCCGDFFFTIKNFRELVLGRYCLEILWFVSWSIESMSVKLKSWKNFMKIWKYLLESHFLSLKEECENVLKHEQVPNLDRKCLKF